MPNRLKRCAALCALGLAMVALVSSCATTGARQAGHGLDDESTAAGVQRERPATRDAGARVSDTEIEQAETEAPVGATVYRGTGVVIGKPSGRPVAVSASGEVTLNFVDADIREVVRSILGDILSVNFVVDPLVQGTITLQSSRPLARAALLPTLESILHLNGAALVKTDSLYTIVPTAAAPREAPPIRSSRGGEPGYGIQVIPLRFISAAEMAKIIEPIAPEAGILSMDETRNVLVVGGSFYEREAIMEAVDIFDVDWLSGMSFGLFPLEYAVAEKLVDELRVVLGVTAEDAATGVLRLIPIERLNAILAVSPQARYVENVDVWVKRLDRSSAGATPQVFVYYVEFGRAGDIAQVLQHVFGGGGEQTDVSLAPTLQPVESLSTPTFIESDETTGGELASETQTQRPRAVESTVNTAIVAEGTEGEIRIIADELNNAIVVLATAADYERIQTALRKLDVVPLQVVIEATIAEVTLTDELSFGLQWFFNGLGGSFTLSEVAGGAVDSAFPGFSYLLSNPDVRTVLNALQTVTDVNVISSPQLMVLDNQTAQLQVGDSVPIATQSSVSVTDPDAPVVNTIQFRDTGVILSVTPRVNANGLVVMEIEQEVSDVVATTTSGIDSPTIQQRKIVSTVAVQSGNTVALGGLIRDRDNKVEAGVPILRDVPILGFFFGNTTDTVRRTELLVLITPRVIHSQQDALEITDELRRRMRAVEPLHSRIE